MDICWIQKIGILLTLNQPNFQGKDAQNVELRAVVPR